MSEASRVERQDRVLLTGEGAQRFLRWRRGEVAASHVFKGSFRITYTMGRKEYCAAGRANHLRTRHFVQTLEPVTVMEISPVEQHDRTIAIIASNIGLVSS